MPNKINIVLYTGCQRNRLKLKGNIQLFLKKKNSDSSLKTTEYEFWFDRK